MSVQIIEQATTTDDTFPQTSLLEQTNSVGVVTGQPEAATSVPPQPSVIISQISDGEIQAPTASSPSTAASPTLGQLVTETDAQGIPFTSIFGATTLSTPTGSGISSSTTTGTDIQTSLSSASSSVVPSSPSNHSSSTPIGAIVGGVLGGLAIIGIIIVAVVYILRRHPRSKPETTSTAIEDQPPRYPGQDMHELPNSVFVPRELDGTQILEMEGRHNK